MSNKFIFHGKIEGSIVGENIKHANIHNPSHTEQSKNLQQIINDINKNYHRYLLEIGKKEMDHLERVEIIKALEEIKKQINQPQLDREKIKQSGEKLLEKSSYIASICGAIFSLLQLLEI